MVSENGKREPKAPSAVTLAAAIIAAILGFATIYWVLQPSGNDSVAESSAATEDAGGAAPAANPGSGPLAGLNKGEMAAFLVKSAPAEVPDITLETAAGEEKPLADFKGKVVLLNLWATWCHPCREEMPALNELQAKLGGDGFEVVALNIDRGGPEKAEQFLKQVGADHIALYRDPSGKAFSKIHTVGMPTTLLIGRDGKELGRLIGPAEWGSPDALNLVRAAIAAGDGKEAGPEGDGKA